MNTNAMRKRLTHWTPDAGIALTEMALTLPVVFILLAGVAKLSLDMHSSIKRESASLDARLQSSQIPMILRVASGWPRLTAEEPKQSLKEHSLPPLLLRVFGETQCRGQLNSLKIPARGNPSHSENKHIRGRLVELRWHSISAQRSACLLEGSSRLGPQTASPLLLAASQLPTEQLSEQAHLALCPLVARGGLAIRQGVVLGVRAAELRAEARILKFVSSPATSCP